MFKILITILNLTGMTTIQHLEFSDKRLADQTLANLQAQNAGNTQYRALALYS